jgi:pimeloyl-ACP methyl ester carboxylesterase
MLFGIARFFTALLSLVLLAAAGYLLWTWYEGELVRDAAGVLHRERDAWRLWTGLGLLAWSFLGGRLLPFVLARRDTRPTKAVRGEGRLVQSRTGSVLHVEGHGREGAPQIIFTHGWGMDSTFWCYARQDLGDRFSLLLWDLPGLGKSRAADPAAVDLPAFAADLASLIETCGTKRVVLVGHSIGGMIIQTLLRDHPQLQGRIAGVVLLNTTYTNPLRTMWLGALLQALRRPILEPALRLTIWLQPLVWLLNWQSYLSGSAHLSLRIGFGPHVTRSQLEHAALLSTRNPPAALARGDLAMFRWDATGALRALRCPALVIGGDMDIVTKLEASRVMADESELASLQVIEKANHMGPMERAEIYNRLIGEFALRLMPSASSDRARRADGARRPAAEGERDRPSSPSGIGRAPPR